MRPTKIDLLFLKSLSSGRKYTIPVDQVINNRYINLLNDETRKFVIGHSYPYHIKKDYGSIKGFNMQEEQLFSDFMDEEFEDITEVDARLKLGNEFELDEDNK